MSITRFIITGLLSVGLIACGNEADKNKDNHQSVYVTYPEGSAGGSTKQFSAAVEEGKSINVSFKTAGQISRLLLKEGDKVTKGMTIGVLDDEDYRLTLQQVQTQYDQATAEVKRLDEMFKRNNIALNDYEKAKAGISQLKNQLDLVKNKLAYTRLVAPASGYIVEKYMEEGEVTGAGTPVYKIMDNTSLETSVALPAALYARRNEIANVTATSPVTGDRRIPLEVISFVPDADNNALFRLRLRIPDELRNQLMPGMSVGVSLNFNSAGGDNTATIQSRALFERNGKEYVWVVNSDSTVTAKEVKVIGKPNGAMSTVEGLLGSETVIAAGVHHLSENQKVDIIGNIDSLK